MTDIEFDSDNWLLCIMVNRCRLLFKFGLIWLLFQKFQKFYVYFCNY